MYRIITDSLLTL